MTEPMGESPERGQGRSGERSHASIPVSAS